VELLLAQGEPEALGVLAALLSILLTIGFPLALLIGSLLIGKAIERSHFKSLDLRERESARFSAENSRAWKRFNEEGAGRRSSEC